MTSAMSKRTSGLSLALFFGFWWLWVAPLSFHDAVVGAICAVIAVAMAAVVGRRYPSHFSPRLSWASELLYVPGAIATDAGRVLLHLLLRLSGRDKRIHPVYRMPFHSGSARQAPAKRATAITLSTLSPNSVTIDIDESHALVHQLHPGPRPDTLERMGRS